MEQFVSACSLACTYAGTMSQRSLTEYEMLAYEATCGYLKAYTALLKVSAESALKAIAPREVPDA